MSDCWQYRCGELCARSSTRVYRRHDGKLGKVVRAYGSMTAGGLPAEKSNRVVVRYFVWALPDNAPEYETEVEAEQALAANKSEVQS